jgi:hypothetical protein
LQWDGLTKFGTTNQAFLDPQKAITVYVLSDQYIYFCSADIPSRSLGSQVNNAFFGVIEIYMLLPDWGNGGHLNYDELVVYDDHALLPAYLIIYEAY